MRRLAALMHRLLEIVLPAPCPICDGFLPWTAPAGICPGCWAAIRPVTTPLCGRCGRRFPHLHRNDPAWICPPCRRRPPPYRRALSLGRYERQLREIILLLKFGDRPEAAGILGALLAVYARHRLGAPDWDAVIAVPMHRARRWRRGYNPAAELARHLARRLQLPRLRRSLVRVRNTPPQTGLPRRERRRNVLGAFRVRHPDRLRGRTLILIDDVLTTGATAAECARVLRRAGARHVDLLTVARSEE